MTIHPCPDCCCVDPIQQWLAGNLLPTEGHDVPTANIWTDLLHHAASHPGLIPDLPTQNRLTRYLRTLGYVIEQKGGRGNHVIGHRLAD